MNWKKIFNPWGYLRDLEYDNEMLNRKLEEQRSAAIYQMNRIASLEEDLKKCKKHSIKNIHL